MRTLILVLIASTLACTKKNPNLCCTDAADCAAHDLPAGTSCEDGLVCRGNQCIAETCTAAAECDPAAPFCALPDGLCTETCTDDSECPGFGQSAADTFCVDGTCAACRIGMADCSGATPVCDMGACRACKANTECTSGVCTSDGTCANESDIAYVDVAGSATSECTRASPCSTPARALGLMPARPYILIASGTYASDSTITVTGKVSLIGSGSTQPKLTRTTPGAIVTVSGTGTDVTIDNIEVSGATSDTNNRGYGIDCPGLIGVPTVHLRGVLIDHAADDGLRARCNVDAVATTFDSNGGWAVDMGGTGTFDRCVATRNVMGGLNLDGGVFSVTNSVIAHNQDPTNQNFVSGIDLYSEVSGSRIEFNTIADNGIGNSGVGFNCNLPEGMMVSFPNNIIVRNNKQTNGTACTYPSSIILDTDISSLHFKSADTAPYDYHITAGSIAIDKGTISTIDHDFDGDPRPMGAAADVGADEVQ